MTKNVTETNYQQQWSSLEFPPCCDLARIVQTPARSA